VPGTAAAADVAPADWLVRGVRGFAESVHSLVPAGFSAYVRIFHPAFRRGQQVRWAEIAAANGTLAHPGMQLCALTGSARFEQEPQASLYDRVPDEGTLPPELGRPLTTTLARHTRTPQRCWLAVWHGFGALPSETRAAPTFALPNREYHLLVGPVAAATLTPEPPFRQSPNIWWPDDRAWCVATEIDLKSTYVGCGDACREALLALPELEAVAIDPATGIDWRSDVLNPFE
jgi:hypothetical protein